MSRVLSASFWLYLTLVLTSGCSLTKLCVEKPFNGLEHGLTLTGSRDGTLRMLVIHGMQNHTQGYSSNFTATVAKRLGLGLVRSEVESLTSNGKTNGVLAKTSFQDASGKKRIRAYELTWTPATQDRKAEAFAFDAQLDRRRAVFNRRVKRSLLNDGFGDAALYVGDGFKRQMQNPITNALGRIVADGFKTNDEFAIITHSLGSKMAFDSISVMVSRTSGSDEKTAEGIRRLAAQTRYLIMFANQIPLLRLGDTVKTNAVTAPMIEQSQSVQQFVSVRREAKGPRSPLQIIAVTDPNDILSYPLQATDISSDSIPNLEFGNVFIANTLSWFGLIANPIAAHNAYFENSKLLKLLIKGHHKAPRQCLKPPRNPRH